MKMQCVLMKVLDAEPWVINEGKPDEKRGARHFIKVMLENGDSPKLKVSEELHIAISRANYKFGNVIDIQMEPKTVLKVRKTQYGERAEEVMEIVPIGFEYVAPDMGSLHYTASESATVS